MSTSPLSKSLFAVTACITHLQLKRYAENNLPAEEKHDIEKHLIDCELCSKALEGFTLVLVSADEITELNKRIDISTSTKTGRSSAKLMLTIGIGAVLISAAGTFIYKRFNNSQKEFSSH